MSAVCGKLSRHLCCTMYIPSYIHLKESTCVCISVNVDVSIKTVQEGPDFLLYF